MGQPFVLDAEISGVSEVKMVGITGDPTHTHRTYTNRRSVYHSVVAALTVVIAHCRINKTQMTPFKFWDSALLSPQ